jgi:hypothetical protein
MSLVALPLVISELYEIQGRVTESKLSEFMFVILYQATERYSKEAGLKFMDVVTTQSTTTSEHGRRVSERP